MQLVDYTTLVSVCDELTQNWIPARVEQVYQIDRQTISIALRTLKKRDWLTLSWNPETARIHIGNPPPRTPDTFTFSDQLRHQLNGLALISVQPIAEWERVIDLQFSTRPNEEPLYHLYVEIMGKYSNVILSNAKNEIITVAHQVNSKQSSVRTVQTGQIYELPPLLLGSSPSLTESMENWQKKVNLVTGEIGKQLLKAYRGISPTIAHSLLRLACINPKQSNDSLTPEQWLNLYQQWQKWLTILKTQKFSQGWTKEGYTVIGEGIIKSSDNTQQLLNDYYSYHSNQQKFQQLRHQIKQKLLNTLKKLSQKADTFTQRLQESDNADSYREKADLLMAYSHLWEVGMKTITLNDFSTGHPVTIALNPEQNAIQNAQKLYKQYQKLQRAKESIDPLLTQVKTEINYLQQVLASVEQIELYQTPLDLQSLTEIKEELVQENYLNDPQLKPNKNNQEISHPHKYYSPSGYEVLVGRNNRQNDQLTFRIAVEYDLWFHTQEIPGSHVLLRLSAGEIPDEKDLQFVANLAGYYSQARQSELVPVVYTKPKHIYKPKGAKPGMVIYKQETVIWGKPQTLEIGINNP